MFKSASLVIIALLYSSVLSAAEKGPAVPDYQADKVADNVYIIHGPNTTPNPRNQGFMNNPGLVLTSDGAVIVDPGGTLQSGEMVLRVLKKLTDKPVVAVFNTHVHGDHWLGNQAVRTAFPGVPVYGHPNLISRIAGGTGDDWVRLMDDLTEGKSRGTKVVGADTAVNHGDRFTFGDTVFEIHHLGVAHTDNDIMISVNKNSTLFMGDNLVHGRLARSSDGNIKGLIETCEKIVAIQPGVIVPGHGPSGGAGMFKEVLDLYRILYNTVKQQYEQDISDYEMKPAVIEALAAYRDWEDFEDLVGKTISQAFLEIEEADF